jgi:hypothetical protein
LGDAAVEIGRCRFGQRDPLRERCGVTVNGFLCSDLVL